MPRKGAFLTQPVPMLGQNQIARIAKILAASDYVKYPGFLTNY